MKLSEEQKTLKSSSLLQVGRPIVGITPVCARLAHYLRWAPRRWPIEAWECPFLLSPCVKTWRVWLAGRHEVMTSMLQAPEWFSKLPGPGEPLRSALGWTPLLHTPSSGVWFFRGALRGADFGCTRVVSRLRCKGHLPHNMGGNSALPLFICVWMVGSRWATDWGTLLGASL